MRANRVGARSSATTLRGGPRDAPAGVAVGEVVAASVVLDGRPRMAQRNRMAADPRSVRSDLEILTMNVIDQWHGEGWSLFNGDSAEVLQGLETASIDFAVFSPPFAQLFTYSDSPRDLGNVKDDVEFFRHYRFISCELYRVLKPGRVMAVHCMDLLTTKATHGVEGLRDFSGGLVAHHTPDGFVYRESLVEGKKG